MEKYRFDKKELEIIEKSPIPFAVYQFIDQRVVTVTVSDGFLKLLKTDNREGVIWLMDHDMYRSTHPDDVARVSEASLRFAAGGDDYDVTYRVMTAEGYRILHAHGNELITEDGVRLCVTYYTDEGPYEPDAEVKIGELNQFLSKSLREESLYRESYFDSLTGLPNMTYFFELAEAGRNTILAEGGVMALLFIDFAGMKHFNSKHGFAEGDRLLRAFADLLTKHFNNENCSRFAQDHFVVYMAQQGIEEKLEQLFEECKEINSGKSLPVRVGIFLDETGQLAISEACDRARAACETDRDAYMSYYNYFDSSLQESLERRQYIIDSLDKAIAERWIQVYYQPIIRSANDSVCDEEALARWIDPEKGLLSPAEFIPVLEDTSLIYKLDLYVVDEIIAKMKKQEEGGLFVVPISVNLSRSDFDRCDIVEEIRQRVDDAGISRNMLTIEITESTIGSDFEFMKTQIERFREMGFQVWMDDFGSAYSSLDLLQSIRFDLIKFDMSFMRKFDQGEESRIILTELIKMAIGLEVETLCEGVETSEQVNFLKEVGCNKLQGFYYCKPIPLEQILKRYETGTQIGFENPEESAYYSAIGGVNLYDLSAIAHEERESFEKYFDTIPMAIIETTGDVFRVARCNKSYRTFMENTFQIVLTGVEVDYELAMNQDGADFLNAVRQCGQEGGRLVVDEEMSTGMITHALIRRVAVNPVTGTAAVAAAVLSISDGKDNKDGVSFARIARTLAADYFNLFYVDLNTEQFIAYSSEEMYGSMALERHGDDFFRSSREDALHLLHENDQESFVRAFTKENVVRSLDENGAFTHTYRLKTENGFVYANMKAVRLKGDPDRLIIGVSSVDAQMRDRIELERITEEHVIYGRIAALVGDYLAIYTVEPDTGKYVEYSSQGEYVQLGLPHRGSNFFKEGRARIRGMIHPNDLQGFLETFNKENILRTIGAAGYYRIYYRLMIDGTPTPVSLKAVLVEEEDGPVMIVGVNFAGE